MSFRQLRDPGQFFQEAYAALSFESSRNSLLLGVATQFQFNLKQCAFLGIVGSEAPDPQNIYALISEHQGEKIFVCSSHADFDEVNKMVQGCVGEGIVPTQIFAEQETAKLLKISFEEYGYDVQLKLQEQVMKCNVLEKPETAKGLRLMTAGKSQLELVEAWTANFMLEALSSQDKEMASAMAKKKIKDEQVFLLHNGETFLAMAGWSRALPETISVNMVYVPPENRNQGFGKAMVYWITRHLLEHEGYHETNLYADLTNAAALSLYESIGYEAISIFDKYTVSRA